jgi:hypothetical protein
LPAVRIVHDQTLTPKDLQRLSNHVPAYSKLLGRLNLDETFALRIFAAENCCLDGVGNS